MPPIAPAIGSAAWLADDSSPATNSRLTSSPTSKKNTVIKPSLIHSCRVRDTEYVEAPTLSGSDHNRSYAADHGELAMMSAAAALTKSSTPAAASVSKKRWNGRDTGAEESLVMRRVESAAVPLTSNYTGSFHGSPARHTHSFHADRRGRRPERPGCGRFSPVDRRGELPAARADLSEAAPAPDRVSAAPPRGRRSARRVPARPRRAVRPRQRNS